MTRLEHFQSLWTDLIDPRVPSLAKLTPARDAVPLPSYEIPSRIHELPAPGESLRMIAVEPWFERAVEIIGERNLIKGSDNWADGEPDMSRRLWQPNEYLMSQIDQLTPGRALDVGCGCGREAVALSALGWDVTALDKLPDAIILGKELQQRYAPQSEHSIRWIKADSDKWQTEESFDLIVMFFHLSLKVIGNLERYLKPGGSLIIETFSSAHRERTGRPARQDLAINPNRFADENDLWTREHLEVHHTPERETVRVHLRRRP